MTTPQPLTTMTRSQVIDRYFLEHRAKLIEVAAFLDRVERAPQSNNTGVDYRVAALKGVLAVMGDDQPEKTKRVLELLSDPTQEPIDAAPGKGASGAYDGRGTTGDGGGS